MDKNEILNIGLSLAMEFGQHWLEPIQSRLAKHCPDLTPHELNEYNSVCQTVMKVSNNLVYSMAGKDGLNINQKDWEKTILNSYPWINRENLDHLFSQGMYYARK